MNAPLQPGAPELPPDVKQHYQIGVTLENSPGAHVSVGQEGTSIHQQTWPQKLASHSAWYWFVHFAIGVLAAAAVEMLAHFVFQK